MKHLLRFLLTLLTLAADAVTLANAAPRNIVLFVADDMGQDAGCYGNPDVKTPALDQLASEGTRYRFAFCTSASCSASRSVILSGLQNHATGHYGHAHGSGHFSTYASVQSLPAILARHGYRTARSGKYHLAPESVYPFQEVLPGDPWNPQGMADQTRTFLAEKQKPFFLYFCPVTPHRSGSKMEKHPLQPNSFGNHKSYPDLTDVVYDERKLTVPAHLPDTPTCRAELAQYYQAISRTDAGLARLISLLKESGQYDKTVILFASDNGKPWPGAKTTLYEPGMRLPLVVRSPDPSRRGVVSDALVSWVDLTPTILDIAGVQEVQAPALQVGDPEGGRRPNTANPTGPLVKYEFHGRSFLPTLDGSQSPGWDVVFASHQFHEIQMYYPMRAIRTDRYKLILNLAHPLPFPFASDLQDSATWTATLKSDASHYGLRRVADYLHRPRYELYDLKNDPEETTNLAGRPEKMAVFDELASQLKAYQQRTRDPWFTKYEYE